MGAARFSVIGKLFLVLALFPSPASQAAGPPWPTTEILHVAYRGGSGEAPELTLAAFQNAIDSGAYFIECDLNRTLDNVLICFHDSTLDRTTNGTGPVSAQTLAQLKLLDAGSHFGPEFAGEQIPTLQETLLLAQGQAVVWIHPKIDDFGADVAALLSTLSLPDSAVAVCSSALYRISGLNTEVPGALVIVTQPGNPNHDTTDAFLASPEAAVASAVWLHYSLSADLELYKQLLHRFHVAGYAVVTQPLFSAEHIATAVDMGVDAIMTALPSRLDDYLETLECANGVDDDGDTFTDFVGNDPECDTPTDRSEKADCEDDLDNDLDGISDYPDDTGCIAAIDASERDPLRACDDGVDNDGDGWLDFGFDLGCQSAQDNSETPMVPSLSTWGLVLTGLILGATGAYWRRRSASS